MTKPLTAQLKRLPMKLKDLSCYSDAFGVSSFDGLYHLEDPRQATKERLKANGHLIALPLPIAPGAVEIGQEWPNLLQIFLTAAT